MKSPIFEEKRTWTLRSISTSASLVISSSFRERFGFLQGCKIFKKITHKIRVKNKINQFLDPLFFLAKLPQEIL